MVQASKTSRKHSVVGWKKYRDNSSLSQFSTVLGVENNSSCSHGSRRSSGVSQATDWPNIGTLNPEKRLGVWSISRRSEKEILHSFSGGSSVME